MRIDDFLGRLQGVRANGDGSWMACCPAHDDRNPSMSVTERNGKILVHCHAGCAAADIAAALGLEMRDLFTDDRGDRRDGGVTTERNDGGASEQAALGTGEAQPEHKDAAAAKRMADSTTRKRKSGSHGRRECAYTYRGVDGEVLFEVVRYIQDNGKKTFLAFHPKPDGGGFDFGIHDKTTGALLVKAVVPYHLPQLISATKAGRTVVIVEGEKDVQTVEGLGFPATCNPFGSLKWGLDWPENWGEWFQGAKRILIIADHDAETITRTVRGKQVTKEFLVGQKHAWDVRRKLVAAGVTCPIKLMTMPAVGDATPKDVTDWVDARRSAGLPADAAAFQESVKTAAEWPTEWQFTDEALAAGLAVKADVARAEKSARDAVSDTAAAATERVGRFGRPVPRTPDKEPLEYMVDFDIGGGKRTLLKFGYGWSHERMFAYAMSAVSEECPGHEVPRGVPVRLKAWCAAIWLLMRGSFFWHNDYRDFSTCMFLDRDKSGCRLMRVLSDEFFAFVGDMARLEDVDPKKGDMAKILGLVKQIAVSKEYSRGVTPSNSWDRRGQVVYISSGDTEMCRIDSQGAKMVQNGTDGVVFLRGKTLAPWSLLDGDGVDPFATAALFQGASFADGNGLMNVRLWVMNLFANHATKPPLLITGGAGSGKTRMAKGIKEILGMRQDGALDLSVQQIEDGDKGLDAFWATVNDGKLEVFDNFDTKVKWASDTLQTAATDGQTKRRTLYTTFGVSILRANASIILTSNNPVFSTEGNGGLADRLITIPLSLNRSSSRDAELSREIAQNRDRYMTWFSRTLSKVLADDKPVDASVNRRHPDYGVFSVRVGRVIGDERGVVEALGAAEADKALLPLRNDGVTKEILEVLRESGWSWSGTSGEMSGKIIARMGEDGDDKTKQIYSPRRVGKALNKYLRQFGIIFNTDLPRISAGKTVYSFHGLTVLGSSVVGLVDLKGGFEKIPGGAGVYGFMENGVLNPPNPPDGALRARTGDMPLFEKREDIGSMDSEELEGDDDLVF